MKNYYFFSVYYTTSGSFELDDHFDKLAGVEHDSSGTFLVTMERDLGYRFSTKQKADDAYARIAVNIEKSPNLQKAGARVDESGVSTSDED